MTLEWDLEAAQNRIKELEADLEVERQGRILAFHAVMDALGMPKGAIMVTENVTRHIRDLRGHLDRVIGEREDFRDQLLVEREWHALTMRQRDKLEYARNAEREIVAALLEQLALAAKDAENASVRAVAAGNELASKILMDAAKIMGGVSADTTKLLAQIQVAFEAPTQEDTSEGEGDDSPGS